MDTNLATNIASHATPHKSWIDMDDRRDVHYWCDQLDCDMIALSEAVEQVGPGIASVELHLKKRSNATLARLS